MSYHVIPYHVVRLRPRTLPPLQRPTGPVTLTGLEALRSHPPTTPLFFSRSYIRKGIGSFVRNYVSTLCPVVIWPYLCTSDSGKSNSQTWDLFGRAAHHLDVRIQTLEFGFECKGSFSTPDDLPASSLRQADDVALSSSALGGQCTSYFTRGPDVHLLRPVLTSPRWRGPRVREGWVDGWIYGYMDMIYGYMDIWMN